MSQLVDAASIEQIVGVSRDSYLHYGRAVSDEQMVYILHSQACLDESVDLRDCVYSLALDEGIDVAEWDVDTPVHLGLVWDRLVGRAVQGGGDEKEE